MTKRKCTKTIYEINNLGESYFVTQLKTILRSHDCDIETLKKQITDGIVVKDFTVDGILPDENGNFITGYNNRIKELEEKTVEVDETYLTKDEEGKITFGNNGTIGEIESPIIIRGEREGVTSLLPGSVKVENSAGEELKLTPDSLELADSDSSSYYSSKGISYQKGENLTNINLPESTGETYNFPLTVNNTKADEFGNIDIPFPEVISDGKTISYNDNDEIQLGVSSFFTDSKNKKTPYIDIDNTQPINFNGVMIGEEDFDNSQLFKSRKLRIDTSLGSIKYNEIPNDNSNSFSITNGSIFGSYKGGQMVGIASYSITPDHISLYDATDGTLTAELTSYGRRSIDAKGNSIMLPDRVGIGQNIFRLPLVIDGFVASRNGIVTTGYKERIEALEKENNTLLISPDGKTITLNDKGEIQLGSLGAYNREIYLDKPIAFIKDDKNTSVIITEDTIFMTKGNDGGTFKADSFSMGDGKTSLKLNKEGIITVQADRKFYKCSIPTPKKENAVLVTKVDNFEANTEGEIVTDYNNRLSILESIFNNTSPDGTKWKLGVDNNGNLITTKE